MSHKPTPIAPGLPGGNPDPEPTAGLPGGAPRAGSAGWNLPAVEQAKACTPCPEAAPGATLPFVILHHTGHGRAHWDFLLQVPGSEKLLTWRLALPPEKWPAAPPTELAATRLPDHRPIYLTYEGPISGNRGQVQRVASGTAAILTKNPAALHLRLSGDLNCDLSLPL